MDVLDTPVRPHARNTKLIALLLSWLLIMMSYLAQAQSANLDQGSNDKYTTPVSPVNWINGNLNFNSAHFLEGYSVPYRAVLKGLVVNQTYTLVIGFDVMNGGKHSLDYITHFQRLESHTQFGHAAETVNPLLGITGFPASYFTTTDVLAIPAPGSAGSPVAGQPTASFNALAAAEKLFTGYNAALLSITYASEGSLTASQSETVVNVTFKALKETAVLAWGGHIASVDEWGTDPVTHTSNSASGINGSPYHMRLKNWIINGNVVSIGNQDRSLKTDAVFIPPACEVSGPANACAETPKLSYTATVDDANGLTYAWSITGANTANAKIVNPTLGAIDVVPVGTAFTPGYFNLQLIVTRNGLKDTCYLGGHDIPGVSVIIAQVTVDAGTDQAITHLDEASLSATASGGTGTYNYSWSPVTGLSNPNIANPVFTPPSTGTFQFIVTASDGNSCVDVDTVVVVVTEHPKPPCGVTGPSPVCPGTTNEYAGPAADQVGSYLWTVAGDATISGDNNKEKVQVQAAGKCGSFTLQVVVTTPDGKVKDSCTLTVPIQDEEKPVLSGDVSDATVSCAGDVPAPPTVTAKDNCVAGIQVQSSAEKVDELCVNKFTIVRKWWATDLCGNTSDTLVQIITVNDDVKPVITADFEKEISVQCLKDVPAPPAPTAIDNCDGNLAPVYSEEGSGSACDSTINRTWTFTDACGNSDFVMQVIHVKDNIAPVLNSNVTDVTVACAGDIPAAAGLTATDNCDAQPVVHYSENVVERICANKFTVLRKWWAIDACGNMSDTVRQTITVNDDVKPVITADFEKEVNVECLKDVPAPPAPTATDNCDGNLAPVYSEEGAGTACDSTITRTWTFTDACGNSDFVTQVIRVKDVTPPALTYQPPNAALPCGSAVQFGTPVFTDNCNGEVKVTYEDRKEGATCPFTYIRRWTATDACGNSNWAEQAITVECCKESACTYTQGFYGNKGGTACTPSGTAATAKQLMSAAVDAQAGDSVLFGLKATGRFFTLFLGDVTGDNIFNMLPGGGTPAALKGYATYTKTNTWGNVPVLTAKSNYGRISNVLLSQTMTLFFNLQLNAGLGGLAIQGDSLFTAQSVNCGDKTPGPVTAYYIIPANVVNYLQSAGSANVAGIYALANKYLGGQTVAGVSMGDVNNAVDAINRGFDKCAFLIRWASSSAVKSSVTLRNTVAMMGGSTAVTAISDDVKLEVNAFPNPFRDKLTFRFTAPVTGHATLEVFNLAGQSGGQINYGTVEKGSVHTIEYKSPAEQKGMLIYKLSVGNRVASGKILKVE